MRDVVESPDQPSPDVDDNTPAAETTPTDPNEAPSGEFPTPPVAGESPEGPAEGSKQKRPVTFTTAALAGVSLALTIALGVQTAKFEKVTVTQVAVANPDRTNGTDASAVHEAVKESVVAIRVPGGSVGTGFFYATDSIVTNAHVITGSTELLKALNSSSRAFVDITFNDGTQGQARVQAYDVVTDLAILKVTRGEGSDSKAVPSPKALAFRETSKLAVGEDVLVSGYPFGEKQTITDGILSSIAERSRFAETDAQSVLLQTTAAVNPGNSGGPLLDSNGAVVGVVTLRPDSVDSRTVSGTALALTADQVRSGIAQLERTGAIRQARVGITMRGSLHTDDVRSGVHVVDVEKDSPAQKAGLKTGDVIKALGGSPTKTTTDLTLALLNHKPGDSVRLNYERNGKNSTASVVLGEKS